MGGKAQSPIQQITCECGSQVWVNHFSIDENQSLVVKGRCLGRFDSETKTFQGGCGHKVGGVIEKKVLDQLWAMVHQRN